MSLAEQQLLHVLRNTGGHVVYKPEGFAFALAMWKGTLGKNEHGQRTYKLTDMNLTIVEVDQ